MTFWAVRAGKYGGTEEYAVDRNVIAIGWDEVGDLSFLKTRAEILARLTEIHPDKKLSTVRIWAGELFAFRSRMTIGDHACIPLKLRSAVAIGRISGEYCYVPGAPEGARHQRAVTWLRTDIARTEIDIDLRHSLNSTLTVFTVARNNAERRLISVASGTSTEASPAAPNDELEVNESEFDFETYATDEITRFISNRFHGHDLARLVAGVLAAQSYSVEISPPGPDGGVDIIAGAGPMGFGEPRLAVQVKSGKTPVDVTVLRSLRGVMPEFGATHGLIVSWGGFNKAVYAEVRSLYFKIRLWDAGDLIAALQAHYDSLSPELRSELPLKRTWHLVDGEE